jgi:hypothetical protein
MPFSSRDQRIHSTTDWEIMQQAHNQASRMLDRCPKTHARCNHLARIVIAIYQSGVRDIDELAVMAANRELNVLAEKGYFQQPFRVASDLHS